jgi:CPA2 family monovalent cation:H+ antiporter-2
VFFLIPFICAYIASKLKISSIVGYLIGGLVLGNLFGSTISQDQINNFAYFGIILLMFTVGLEVNFNQMMRLKRFIIIGGLLQMVFSTLLITIFSLFFGFDLLKSFLVGIAISSSSTTLVAKIIQDRGEESSFIGEIAIGILMFQDLAFIPFLIIFNSITSQSSSFWQVSFDVILGIIQAGVILSVMFFLGKKYISVIFDRVAKKSHELLNFFIVLFILFTVYLSSLFHIPILIGVFISGILVGQTLENHHIFSQIRPFRDILAIVFFVYIGLNIQIGAVAPMFLNILAFTLGISLIKAIIILTIFIVLRFHSRVAFSLSLFLFQITENAFILMFFAYKNGIMAYQDYLFVSTSILLSLLFTPIVINNKDNIYLSIRKFIKRHMIFLEDYINLKIDQDKSPIDELNLRNHVVICGYGRVGGDIGRALTMADIPYIAIDYNFHTVQTAKKQGVNIIYGDPTDINILDYAEIESANALISVVPESFCQEAIVLNAKKMNKDIFIIARVHRKDDQQRMRDLGVDLVIHPEFEASLSIIKKILYMFKLPKEEIIGKVKRMKIEHGMV